MITKRRIYVVGGKRLVRSYGPTSARNHVAKDTIKVELASQDTLIELIAKGVEVESTDAPWQADIEDPKNTQE